VYCLYAVTLRRREGISSLNLQRSELVLWA